jgi:hypothetical protein
VTATPATTDQGKKKIITQLNTAQQINNGTSNDIVDIVQFH